MPAVAIVALGVLGLAVLALALSSAQPGPVVSPTATVTLGPGTQGVTADQGTSIAIGLPPGASWVSLSPVNGTSIAVTGTGLLHVVATSSGTVVGSYRAASGQFVSGTLQVTAQPIGG